MPQAILLQDVETLGERGAVVDVSAGYLRNYLLPAQARRAGDRRARSRRPRAGARAPSGPKQEAEDRARENAALLGRTVLTIPQQAGDDGRLFGSVTTQDIADAIRDARGIKRRPPQDPPRGPDPQHRDLHGRGRGRRRGDRDDQDDGRRRLALRRVGQLFTPPDALGPVPG